MNELTRTIAKQWLAFSKTEAWKDFEEYATSTSNDYVSRAKYNPIPYQTDGGRVCTDSSEMRAMLLTTAYGCDIILEYAKQFIDLASQKTK